MRRSAQFQFPAPPLIVGLLSCICLAAGCDSQTQPQSKTSIRFAMPDGSSALTNVLIEEYGARLHDAVFSRTNTPGTVMSIDNVDTGRAEVTMIPSDVAYLAFTKGTDGVPHPHTRLRGMAMLYVNAIHLLVSKRIDFRSLDDLRGKTIGVGPKGGNTEFTIRTVLPYLGISLSEVRLEPLSREGMAERLADGTLDATFIAISYPASSVLTIMKDTGSRLVPIDGPRVDRLRREYPFLRPVTIPAGTYGNEKIATVGSNWLLACNADLSEDIVYRMLSVFVNSIEELAETQPALLTVIPQNFALTPIPLHPGAARFYREMELLR